MKRPLLTILLFLLLGAVANVAVAWGCGVWLYPRDPFLPYDDPHPVSVPWDDAALFEWWTKYAPDGFSPPEHGYYVPGLRGVSMHLVGGSISDLHEEMVRLQGGSELPMVSGGCGRREDREHNEQCQPTNRSRLIQQPGSHCVAATVTAK